MPSSNNFNTHYIHWMGPVLEALRELGGSASPREVSALIARKLDLSQEFTESTVKSGANRFRTQVAFARQYLVWEGFLDDGTRGVWKLTPLGWKTELNVEQARVLSRERNLALKATSQQKLGPTTPIPPLEEDAVPVEVAQEFHLLDILKALPPYGFELICGRLLREHGFEEVEVTQRSRDGGIDGYGLLRLSPFVSLRVAFQAKRYKDVVSRSAVGEFRNALLGRAEKAYSSPLGASPRMPRRRLLATASCRSSWLTASSWSSCSRTNLSA